MRVVLTVGVDVERRAVGGVAAQRRHDGERAHLLVLVLLLVQPVRDLLQLRLRLDARAQPVEPLALLARLAQLREHLRQQHLLYNYVKDGQDVQIVRYTLFVCVNRVVSCRWP